ncbi:MAG: non-canonical purine NTP pyrophosphatase [Deltaproteobacteria bacterium]|uniref:dITP/XTP pyrophosphatase n=1 Tax=Candidatus Acidulodesulfobacterium acidiphilum TaxID=2597224 RepID=A0A520X864_9DELT|nr:non-canonical purine NTP pyrophosphatase [Deltaproteobacteria bacterium]RZV37380.1 MAG: non-canonical purine NTP pyrophosphatase [Candidatus Acidulodesulfobacterium acidiphilum]
MSNVLIATGNAHKFQEIEVIMGKFADLSLNLVYLDKSYRVEIVEDRETYEENAKIKVEGYLKFLEENPELRTELNLDFIVGEDSGLEVECLEGAPGLFTARYAGENASDIANIEKLLNGMEFKKECAENRRAKFVCYACLYDVKKNSFEYFYGELKGLIAEEISGTKGFGYDPVFIVPQFNKTAAQIGAEEKNAISHRAAAFGKVAEAIKNRRS